MQEQSGARSLAGRGHMHCRYYSIVWSALCLAFLLCSNTAVAGAAGSNMVRNFAGGVTNQLAFVKPSSFPLIGRRAPKPEGSLAEEAHAFLVSSSTGERIALSAAATMATRILLGDWNQTAVTPEDGADHTAVASSSAHVKKMGMGPLDFKVEGGSVDDGGFTLDLGQVTKIGAFLIKNKRAKGAKSGTKQYYIQVSIDGVKWHRAHRGGLKPATDGCLSCLPTPSQLALLTKCEEARYIRFRTLSSYPGGKGISSIRVFAQKGIRYILPLVYPIGAIDSIRTSRSQDAFTGTLQMPESSPAAPSLVSRMLTYASPVKEDEVCPLPPVTNKGRGVLGYTDWLRPLSSSADVNTQAKPVRGSFLRPKHWLLSKLDQVLFKAKKIAGTASLSVLSCMHRVGNVTAVAWCHVPSHAAYCMTVGGPAFDQIMLATGDIVKQTCKTSHAVGNSTALAIKQVVVTSALGTKTIAKEAGQHFQKWLKKYGADEKCAKLVQDMRDWMQASISTGIVVNVWAFIAAFHLTSRSVEALSGMGKAGDDKGEHGEEEKGTRLQKSMERARKRRERMKERGSKRADGGGDKKEKEEEAARNLLEKVNWKGESQGDDASAYAAKVKDGEAKHGWQNIINLEPFKVTVDTLVGQALTMPNIIAAMSDDLSTIVLIRSRGAYSRKKYILSEQGKEAFLNERRERREKRAIERRERRMEEEKEEEMYESAFADRMRLRAERRRAAA